MSVRRPKLLIVDDGERYAELAHALLRDYDYATRCDLPGPCWECPHRPHCTLTHAHDWSETREALASQRDVDAVLLDVAFDLPEERLLLAEGGDVARSKRLQGIEILRRLREREPSLPVILMTSLEELRFEDAAEALGVDEFVTLAGREAFDARSLALLIERVLARARPASEPDAFFFGQGAAMRGLQQSLAALAPTSLPMLVLGETGTGKSALAEQVIHPQSGRGGPFVHVDAAAIPEHLIAAELFGTARGAFSGAVDRPGRFELAHRGSLFLDEIGNLPLEAQRTLLVALQSGRVCRLGEGVARAVDVKLIAATHVDLAAAVRAGGFRADLYARLNPSAATRLPPLRERMEDLLPLAERALLRAFETASDAAVLQRYLDATGNAAVKTCKLEVGPAEAAPKSSLCFALSKRSAAELRAHAWPGNVRELGHVITTAALLALSTALAAVEQQRAARGTEARTVPLSDKVVRSLLHQQAEASAAAAHAPAQGLRPESTLHAFARALERDVYRRLFGEHEGDFAAMAGRMLLGDRQKNARKVRLRFNQLGLRARNLRAGRVPRGRR